MRFEDNQIIYESALNNFDLHDRVIDFSVDPHIKEPDKPIGIYRAFYKNGIEIAHWIQPIE